VFGQLLFHSPFHLQLFAPRLLLPQFALEHAEKRFVRRKHFICMDFLCHLLEVQFVLVLAVICFELGQTLNKTFTPIGLQEFCKLIWGLWSVLGENQRLFQRAHLFMVLRLLLSFSGFSG
jgi:hypothetical protein